MRIFDPADIPDSLSKLSKISKSDLLAKLTDEPFKQAIKNVLVGKNVREFTESLSRARLTKSYVETLQMYLALQEDGEALDDIVDRAVNTLQSRKKGLSPEKVSVVQWMLGLTDKLSQNLLRDSVGEALTNYAKDYKETIKKHGQKLSDFSIQIEKKSGDQVQLNSTDLLHLFNMIGAQTLTIRGSEKSTHGKNFEKLILGSVFQYLGFRLQEKNTTASEPFFWLSSETSDTRESDASVFYKKKGVRVDIGFIGRGNTEISLDKVARYTRQEEIMGEQYRMETIVIVDRIGERSKIHEMANKIDGTVYPMSDPLWVVRLSDRLKSIFKSEKIGLPFDIREREELEQHTSSFVNGLDLAPLLR